MVELVADVPGVGWASRWISESGPEPFGRGAQGAGRATRWSPPSPRTLQAGVDDVPCGARSDVLQHLPRGIRSERHVRSRRRDGSGGVDLHGHNPSGYSPERVGISRMAWGPNRAPGRLVVRCRTGLPPRRCRQPLRSRVRRRWWPAADHPGGARHPGRRRRGHRGRGSRFTGHRFPPPQSDHDARRPAGQATRPADAARPASGDTSRGVAELVGWGGAPAATTRRGWERPRTREADQQPTGAPPGGGGSGRCSVHLGDRPEQRARPGRRQSAGAAAPPGPADRAPRRRPTQLDLPGQVHGSVAASASAVNWRGGRRVQLARE